MKELIPKTSYLFEVFWWGRKIMLCYQNKIIPYLDFLSSIILLRFIFNRWCDFISFFTMQCQSFISVRKETKPFWCWRYTWSKQQIEKKNIDEDSEFFKFWQEWARITNIKQYQNRWHWLYSNMELSSIKDFHNFKKSMSALPHYTKSHIFH